MFSISCFSIDLISQNTQNTPIPSTQFWDKLNTFCGYAYVGSVIEAPKGDTTFTGKKLIAHVKWCEAHQIKIPLYVDTDRSRTWVLSNENGLIQLKHDHRHQDGSHDPITNYGGLASNFGTADRQIFPADEKTRSLLPHAAGNVWWITIDNDGFSYHLMRIGTDRRYTLYFRRDSAFQCELSPWGH